VHEYVRRCARAFEEAAADHVVERRLMLAERVLELRMAGATGPLLGPAFGHLDDAPDDQPTALTIRAWDRASTAVAAPEPPWAIEDYGPREQIRGVDSRELHASYDPGNGLLSLAPSGGHQAIFHALDAARIPRWVVRMPFRRLLGWWAADEGLTFVHAAAVGSDGACLLLPGASGSGKSTTALAASEWGLEFLADDLCLVDVGERRAYAPFAWAKAETDALSRIPSLAARVTSTEQGQSLLSPANRATDARIAGIAVPHVSGRSHTAWRPATASEAVFALAPSTMIEGNGAGPAWLGELVRLARAVPTFRLDLGTDIEGVAGALREVFAAARG
jgi:hypothetical protein